MMYGTVAKLRFKSGSADEAMATVKAAEEAAASSGAAAVYLFRMDADPDEFFLVAIFNDKDAYFANADDPQTNADYEKWSKFLASDPEWHDGEVVYTRLFT
jgi:quinol monooxygenase YgiN